MAHTIKPVTAAEIHQIYGRGSIASEGTTEAPAAPNYRKTSFSGREATHPGYPPPRPPVIPQGRRS